MAIFRTQLSVTIVSSKGAVVFQSCVGGHSVPTKNYSCALSWCRICFSLYILKANCEQTMCLMLWEVASSGENKPFL